MNQRLRKYEDVSVVGRDGKAKFVGLPGTFDTTRPAPFIVGACSCNFDNVPIVALKK